MATSRTGDPAPNLLAACYLAVGLLFVLVALKYLGQNRLAAAVVGVSALALLAFAVLWLRDRDATVTVDGSGVARSGMVGWRVGWDEASSVDVRRIGGLPHVVVAPRQPPKTSLVSLAQRTLGAPRGVLAAPIAPDAVTAMVEAVAAYRPANGSGIPT